MEKRNCLICDKKFLAKRPEQKYCSLGCAARCRYNKTQVTCPICGKQFLGRPGRKYCSKFCSIQRGTSILPKTCIICGSVFQSNNNKYCSAKCYNAGKYRYIEKRCPVCSVTFKIPGRGNKKKKYCSDECMTKAVTKPICPTCGKSFSYRRPCYIGKSIYCSIKCRGLAKRKKVESKCQNCGKIIYVYPKYNTKYCSNKCKHEYKIKKVEKICKSCGKTYWALPLQNLYFCSIVCRRNHRSANAKNDPNWKGGRTRDNNTGYIKVYNPTHPNANGNYVLEHRLVVENILGRYLTRDETVHHIGKKDDNRPENLIVFSTAGNHVRFHFNPSYVLPSDIIFDGRNYKPE